MPIRKRSPFEKSAKVERQYSKALRGVAREVGRIVTGFDIDSPLYSTLVSQALGRYAELLQPWARVMASRIVTAIDAQDVQAWANQSREMARALRQELERAPTGEALTRFLAENVDLITSLPREAAQRVHALTQEGLMGSRRAAEIAAEIMRTGAVTESRAMLIARTEVARTASGLSMIRAEHIGCTHYVWRTSRDGDVRQSHREMDGKVIELNAPPTLSDGTTTHAGQIYNCFTGDTKVDLSNGCRDLFRSPYDGPVNDINAEGVVFSVTPNHPILTNRGWIPAGEIEVGDYLIQMIRDTPMGVDEDIDQSMPTFDEVFLALSPSAEKRLGVEFDLYGRAPDGDVDHVRPDWILPSNLMAERLNSCGNFALSDANCRIVETVCGGRGNHILGPGASGVGNEGDFLVPGEFGKPGDVCRASISPFNAGPGKDGRDHKATDPVLPGKSEFAGPGEVSVGDLALRKVRDFVVSARNVSRDFDPSRPEVLAERCGVNSSDFGDFIERLPAGYKACRVVDNSIRSFSGHVFTMQTFNGWYGVTTAVIISKNCRCYPEIIVPDM